MRVSFMLTNKQADVLRMLAENEGFSTISSLVKYVISAYIVNNIDKYKEILARRKEFENFSFDKFLKEFYIQRDIKLDINQFDIEELSYFTHENIEKEKDAIYEKLKEVFANNIDFDVFGEGDEYE